MRRVLLVVALCGSSACAARRQPDMTPPVPTRYVFSEDLDAATRVCVPRHPFTTDVTCMPLEELRQWLRRRRLVQFSPERAFDEPAVIGGGR